MSDHENPPSDKPGVPLKTIAQRAAIGSAVVGGSTATVVGVIAAGTSTTAAISAGGAAIGGGQTPAIR